MKFISILSSWCLIHATASAALTVSFTQNGSDVVVTATGSLDITGATLVGDVGSTQHTARSYSAVHDDTDALWSFSTGDDVYRISSGGNLFSKTFNIVNAASFSGDTFGLYASNQFFSFSLYVPNGFISGSIFGTMRFANKQVDDFGPIVQTISWGPSPDQSVSIVPEPAPVMFLGIAAVAFYGLRRRTE